MPEPKCRKKEGPRKGIFNVLPAQNMGQEPKEKNRGDGEGKERKPLPLVLFLALTPFFAWENSENIIPPTFFVPQPHGYACYAGYIRARLAINALQNLTKGTADRSVNST